MKLVIAGCGPVGQAVHYALEYHPALQSPYIGSQNVEKMKKRDHAVWVDDPHVLKYDGRTYHNVDPKDVGEIDGVIVCVATPMRKDGTCNTDHVEEVFRKYGDTRYLIKSAVDPVWLTNYAKAFKGSYTYCPEFLRGSHAHANPTDEFMNQEFAIFGGDDCRWWDELFRTVLPNLKNVKYGTLEQAAFAKYVENCFLATKVTFFNEVYKIYHEIGFDGFDQMVDMITLDPRVGRSHTQVPGPDGKFGYGGHCFPKDMAALRNLSNNTPLLDTVVDINEENRK